MNWGRANETQRALSDAEQNFESICDTDGELSDEEVEAAYNKMMRAASDADEALDAIKLACPDWPSVVSSVLR